VNLGEWSDESHRALDAALEQELADTFQQAESFGSLATGLGHAPGAIFDDVYESMPSHLQRQRAEMQAEAAESGTGEEVLLPFAQRVAI
jgi:2-oxoisovalerate dehydrogenase E1 component alpha subunit